MNIRIGQRIIGEGRPVFFIAEAGVNHNGKLKLAKRLVDVAAKAGADAVKFQTYVTENLVDRTARKANYQRRKAKKGESQYTMLKRYELSFKQFETLKRHCDKKKIMFLSTPFDEDSLDFLKDLGVQAYKVGSGDFVNIPFVREIARHRKPMIMSTGMADLKEIKFVVNKISNMNKRLVILHCVSSYPTPIHEADLNFITTLRKTLRFPIGYSDHTEGGLAGIVAVLLGAVVIEKHITLDRKLPGPDQRFSMEPEELAEFVDMVRSVPVALGSISKTMSRDELDVKKIATKSVFAKRTILKGKRLMMEDLEFKRPGGGISPLFIDSILNKRVKRKIKKGKMLKTSDIEGKLILR